ncbi:MAG: non-heme iron oxygenase ferredoxin subunit [Gemmatimonadaceae bacterium]|nr:non-heme iron oxygenase ferredoxin subunit [Gemmatimonadaceae bacterium]
MTGTAGARPAPPTPFELVARLADVPEGGLLGVVKQDGDRVCLVNLGGTIYAVSNTCTHQEFPMSDGVLLPDGCLECAWHGAMFDCRTGAVKRFPATEPLPVYEVMVEGEDIYVGRRTS